jgi:hypothetical protein
MYGPGKAWTDAIREFKGGRLLAKDLTVKFPIHELVGRCKISISQMIFLI